MATKDWKKKGRKKIKKHIITASIVVILLTLIILLIIIIKNPSNLVQENERIKIKVADCNPKSSTDSNLNGQFRVLPDATGVMEFKNCSWELNKVIPNCHMQYCDIKIFDPQGNCNSACISGVVAAIISSS